MTTGSRGTGAATETIPDDPGVPRAHDTTKMACSGAYATVHTNQARCANTAGRGRATLDQGPCHKGVNREGANGGRVTTWARRFACGMRAAVAVDALRGWH